MTQRPPSNFGKVLSNIILPSCANHQVYNGIVNAQFTVIVIMFRTNIIKNFSWQTAKIAKKEHYLDFKLIGSLQEHVK